MSGDLSQMRHLSIAAILLLGTTAALAQDQPAVPPEVQAIFPLNADSCYAARVSPADMKPKQKLTEFYLYRLYDPNPALEEVQLPRDQAIAYFSKPETANWTDLAARFSDTPYLYTQSLACWVSGETGRQVFCGVECDGGSFKLDHDGAGLAANFDSGGGLSLNQSCGEPDDEGYDRWMTASDAGRTVALQKVPASVCSKIERAARPAFAADPVPLRERIAMLGWRCLSRSYDKAHLAKHPKQKVTSIAVAIKEAPRTTAPDNEYPETLLDVSLSFNLRDGKVKSRAVQCRASQYEFFCEGGFRLRRRDASSAWLAAGEYTDKNSPPVMIDTTLGSDDALFRLDGGTQVDCSAR